MADAKSKRWQELADVKRELAKRDWFFGTSGNLSIKVSDDPITFLVTASGKDKRKETNEDFVLVNAAGQPHHPNEPLRPSAETLLHTYVYEQTKAGCCLHVHTIDNNVMSELYGDKGEIRFKGNEIIKALGYWEEDAEVSIPIIENPAHIPQLAEQFAKHLTLEASSGAVLIRNHGITVWGKTAFEAKRVLEAYEFLFSYHLKLALYQQQLVR
ncbi:MULTISPECIES: methylthioribulose 1-phosphate dehydratase [Bacillus]|uniref:methylthioribulose 1-phosphate dehydratase n=1 Tax=Bacillus TaxID=1386 RepID=UPI0005973C03|nr:MULTISPECIES: methylthioribulose 1-phosphate dehydratase [Bacillus]KIL19173.1 Methylthioribulose-1-phosphate dehydratase [Bacillus safensis]MCP8950994.1 methylthioribulose 1-phosphate dehydratase [Bacillus safensis]MEC3736010.1 methylthioribulose 1-phosphate dehydratase [Bacillus safensis]OMP26846.1 methylthioribulose-1-phosphate dehydratase [Bacillus sp. I-2]